MSTWNAVFKKLQNGNDVRGTAIETEQEKITLTPGTAVYIAEAFAEWLASETGKEKKDLRVGIGHDSRVTGPLFEEAAAQGFAGTQTMLCGLVSTPAMFQSTVLPESRFDGAVMITASHLPFNRNGMKFFTENGGLEKAQMADVLARAAVLAEGAGADASGLPEAPAAREVNTQSFDLITAYSNAMMTLIKEEVNAPDHEKPLAGIHVVVDAGNGAAGFFADRILQPLGAEIAGSVYLDPDGTFPNHVPNPENGAAMEAVRKATLDAGADLGVIFDCDGDRAAVVFADGTEVNRNALIALLAVIVSEKAPGSTIVTDSVTSDELGEFLTKHLGMGHLRFKRGYNNVINKGIELNESGTDCELAIETSGHGAFKSNYFSDDGAYICVRILIKMAQLKRTGKRIESLIADLEEPGESIERRYTITAEDFGAYGDEVLEAFRNYAEADGRFHIVEPNYEGVRIAFDDEEVKGWVLLRKSLHDPVMPMNVESKEKGGTAVILNRLKPFFDKFAGLS